MRGVVLDYVTARTYYSQRRRRYVPETRARQRRPGAAAAGRSPRTLPCRMKYGRLQSVLDKAQVRGSVLNCLRGT